MRDLIPGLAFSLAALALILGAAAPACAEPTEAQLSAIKSNCRSDYMSNCWGVPKGAEAMQCLKKHLAKLSPGCQKAVKAATAQPAAAAKPAAPAPAEAPSSTDASTPKAAPAPPPRSAPPPEAAAAPKPPAPADTAKAAPAATPPAAAPAAQEAVPPIIGFLPPRKKLMVLRDWDLKAHCADVPMGEDRNLRCLFSHRAELTPDCQGTLAKLAN